jgi:capsular exopolysaccharide synthesis family protein
VPKLNTGDAEVYLERDPQDIGGEAFRKLRTNIGFLGVERPIKLLLVTSPIASEGKTTCALNLAVAYANAGYRTLLVEADLRRPSLHRVFGLSGTDGLTTVIIGDTLPNRAIRNGEVPNLQCMIAGAIPPNPVELLESEQMGELLQRVRTHFDMVVIDAPPIIPVADSVALAARCDGVIVVARAGSTHRDRLVNAVRQVELSGGRFLGVLINDVRPSDSPYEYEYYYAGSERGQQHVQAFGGCRAGCFRHGDGRPGGSRSGAAVSACAAKCLHHAYSQCR